MHNKELSGAQLSLIYLSKCGIVALAKSSMQRDTVKRNQRSGKSFQQPLFQLEIPMLGGAFMTFAATKAENVNL